MILLSHEFPRCRQANNGICPSAHISLSLCHRALHASSGQAGRSGAGVLAAPGMVHTVHMGRTEQGYVSNLWSRVGLLSECWAAPPFLVRLG